MTLTAFAIVLFLRYLAGLSSEHQIYWHSKEATGDCKMVSEYYQNMVMGKWTNSYSVYSAFIEEQRVINALAQMIFGIKLFKLTFEEEKRPREFTYFLTPTRRNYEAFVHLLDKMLSENLNKEFFENDLDLYDTKQSGGLIERVPKGTLRLLDEWLKENYQNTDSSVYDALTRAFKNIRRERQKPAHLISDNEYDEDFFRKQSNYMAEAYHALKRLRIVFSMHPMAAGFQVPAWLDEGQIKNF